MYNKQDITLARMIEKNNEQLSSDEAVPMFKWIIYKKIYDIIKNKKIRLKFNNGIEYFKELRERRGYNKSIKILKKIYTERYPRGNYEFLKYDSEVEENIQSELALDRAKKSKIKCFKKIFKKVPYTRKEFYKVLEEVEENIFNCLKSINVVIILDDIDELEMNFNEENNSITAINKLIEAFKEINMELSKLDFSPSKCILLLRSDILENLNKRSNNLNKIIQDNTVELYWIDKEHKHPENHELMKMILNKIKKSCKEYEKIDNSTLYNKLFPKNINGDNAVTYLINNSFGRPRDIICYLNIIKKRNPNSISFTPRMFRECKQEYSKSFLRELENELKVHIESDVVDQYLHLLRGFARNTFFIGDLKRYYKSRRKFYKKIPNIEKYLNILYKFGVIGNSWTVKRQGKKDKVIYSWGYRKDGNPIADTSKKFSVHYGLRNILNTN